MPRAATIRRALLFVLLSSALAACGSQTAKHAATSESAGRPTVVLGTWSFVEEDVLGELYAQALRAKGFKVVRKPDLGTSELIDRTITAGNIDLYPEYLGIILTAIAHDRRRQQTSAEVYARAQRFERSRGLALLDRTPFQDLDAIAVKPAFAAAHGLQTVGDLRKLGSAATIGAPPEFRTRLTGLVGLRRTYGVTEIGFHPYLVPAQYAALDSGRVQAIDVSTTDPQLTRRGRYRLLADPETIFGIENVAPVVRRRVLAEQGPGFARTLNAVTRLLTTADMRRMNSEVVFHKRPASAVAHEFLTQHGLL